MSAGMTSVPIVGIDIGPRLIIIGGGVSENASKFLPKIELRTPIVPAQLLNDAGIIGAALLAPDATASPGRLQRNSP